MTEQLVRLYEPDQPEKMPIIRSNKAVDRREDRRDDRKEDRIDNRIERREDRYKTLPMAQWVEKITH